MTRSGEIRGGFLRFNPIRFSLYARDLSLALLDLSEEVRVNSIKVAASDRIHFSGDTVKLYPMANHEEIISALARIDSVTKGNPMSVAGPEQVAKPVIKKNLTGASFLADLIRTQQAAIKAELAQAGTDMVQAITELQGVASEATNQVKAVRAETADLKAALGLNSNGDSETGV